MKRRFRLATAGLLVATHGFACLGRVAHVEPAYFEKEACRLGSAGKWSYGFLVTSREAGFVKAVNPEGSEALGQECRGAVAGIMRRELEEVPFKGVAELVLYVALLSWWVWGFGRLRKQLSVSGRRRSWQLAFSAGSLMATWSVLVFPLLVWGYGTPLYRAFSCSLVPGIAESGPVEWTSAITYHHVLFGAAVPPMLLWTASSLVLPLPDLDSDIALWWLGLGVYGFAAMFFAAIRGDGLEQCRANDGARKS